MDKHNEEHIYVAIDLKSFYASVECRERGKDALTTNLVVADPTRTEKTICLAVSPALKGSNFSFVNGSLIRYSIVPPACLSITSAPHVC